MNKKEGKPKYIYHYLADCKSTEGVKFTLDGIAQMVERIENMDDYRYFKNLVIESEGLDTQIVIRSLSILGEL